MTRPFAPKSSAAGAPAHNLAYMRVPCRSHARPIGLASASFVAAAIAGIVFARAVGAGGQAVADSSTRWGAPSNPQGGERQWIEIRNVDLHLTDQVVLRVRTLHGEVARTSARPATLDDPTSFRIRVTAATVALTGDDLAALLNGVLFAYPGAPLRDLRVRTNGSEIIQTGIMHKGVDLRFRLHGRLDIMPDGRVRIHPTSVSILGVNGEKLPHTLGMHLDNLLDLRRARGASVKGDDLFLDPTTILPPPAIEGRLASMATTSFRSS